MLLHDLEIATHFQTPTSIAEKSTTYTPFSKPQSHASFPPPSQLLSMPTPESAMFLAKKPKVPPTFDGVDYDDTAALKAAQDSIIREQWVQCMMARLIKEELSKCYNREGVNHLEKCGHLRGKSAFSLPSVGCSWGREVG